MHTDVNARAANGEAATSALLKRLETSGAPLSVGPYSQGVAMGNGHPLVFVSGQLPIDPKTGQLVAGDIKAMTSRIIDNLEAILLAGGSSLNLVVRVEVFLTNMGDFSAMNAVYQERFKGSILPARQTVQVAGLPLGSPIEISCIAVRA